MGLLVAGMTQHEVDQGARRRAREVVGQGGPRELARQVALGTERAEPERAGGGDQLRAVAVGEHRVAQRAGLRGDLLVPLPRDPGAPPTRQDLVGDQSEQGLLVAHVVVERAGLHAELPGEPAHAQVGQAPGVEDLERSAYDVVAVVAHTAPPRIDRVMSRA